MTVGRPLVRRVFRIGRHCGPLEILVEIELVNALGVLDKRDVEVVTQTACCTDFSRLGTEQRHCRRKMDEMNEERVLSCRLNKVAVAGLAF